MKLRVFTLPLDPEALVFDDSELVAFLEDREALFVSEHFFTFQGLPTLALLVQYREPALGAEVRRGGGRHRAELVVPPEHQALFEGLRRWRNERAKKDGRPAFVLFTNGQLLAIATHRPKNLETLRRVEGVGEARARDYGQEVLALVQTLAALPDPSVPDADNTP